MACSIDASGTFEGKAYKDVIELQKLLHDSRSVPNCVAQRVYEYGVGRSATAESVHGSNTAASASRARTTRFQP